MAQLNTPPQTKRNARLRRRREKRTPWSYRPGTTPLHRCGAGIKLILLLAFSALPVLGLPCAGGAALLILAGAFSAGLKPRELFAGSLPVAITLIVLTAWRAFSIEAGIHINLPAIKEGLVLAAGILVCFAAASLFFAVTTTTETRKSLAAAETFLFQRQSRLSLALALMLGFLPGFFECWENADAAARARSCRGGIKRIMVILPLVTERMMESAAETAEAIESRGLV